MSNPKKIYIIIGVAVLVLFVSFLVSIKKTETEKESQVEVISQKLEMDINGIIEEVDASGLMLIYPYPPSKLNKTVLFPVRFAPETKFFKLDKTKTAGEQSINSSSLKPGQVVYINYSIIKSNPGNELIAKKIYVINHASTAKK